MNNLLHLSQCFPLYGSPHTKFGLGFNIAKTALKMAYSSIEL